MSHLWNGRKVLFGGVSVWTSVCCNIKWKICNMVDLMNALNLIKVLCSGPLHVRATQLNFFCTFNPTDLEGRSREQDGPHHSTLRPGSSGACASRWGRCWQSLSSCLWGWDCCSRWPCPLDFCRPVNPKYSASCCDQSLSHFEAASWWAGLRKIWNWGPRLAESTQLSPSVQILVTSVKLISQ